MDFEVDVEDFPGLYGVGVDGKKDSDGEHEKLNKKKDKKTYAALEGESSPEEDIDAKSPSKSKKSKAFKFTSSKSKEKREKSRDKEKIEKDGKDDEKPAKEKDKSDKDKDKKKDKERKDKKEKSKDKEKEKKDKKAKAPSLNSTEVLELGDVQPVFGVSVSLATERSRCHDGINLPLVVRDCIDYLQEHALKSEQIYKIEPMKTRLQHYKRLYNNRERQPETDELDIPTACSLLKLFLKELPEPILTTDLMARFEEVAASHAQVIKQQEELEELIEQLPSCNKTLLSWILLHFDSVIRNEKFNKTSVQSLAMLLSPPLQMSHRLLVTLLTHCSNLFAHVKLIKYVPPITSSSPKLPDTAEDIQIELRKQESLLAQIHAEMNAGFVTKKHEEKLWEVQRKITQFKRKLRSFEKKQEKSIDEAKPPPPTTATTTTTTASNDTTDSKSVTVVGKSTKLNSSDDDSIKNSVAISTTEAATAITTDTTNNISQPETVDHLPTMITEENLKEISGEQHSSPVVVHNKMEDGLYVDEATGFLMVAKSHAEYATLIRLQLENQELIAWKTELQSRITAERAEVLRLKQLHQQQLTAKKNNNSNTAVLVLEEKDNVTDEDYEKIIENYIRENTLLEHKKQILAKEIFEERRECITLQVELGMQKF